MRLPAHIFLAALMSAVPAAAGPRTINDCESIKDANAYNLCLASFGPVRGQHGATYPGVASEGEKGNGGKSGGKISRAATSAPETSRHAPRAHGRAIARTRGGRVHMEFTPGQR